MANRRIEPADRLSLVSEYYFSRKLKEVAQLNAEGKDIISLAIGSPDMPPSEQTINKLCEVAHQPNAHGYQPTMGTPELREAMAGFYKRWYNVDLDAKSEVLPLIGSKEGILHVTLAFVNPGDAERLRVAFTFVLADLVLLARVYVRIIIVDHRLYPMRYQPLHDCTRARRTTGV